MPNDTSMGHGPTRFPSTSLSLLAGSGTDRAARLREHLEAVCRRYWRPVYFVIRRRWSKSDAEAKDLTQGFFVHLLDSEVLERFDAQRGNFRPFLKTCLQNFLVNDNRAQERRKRGGGRTFVPVEEWESVLTCPVPDAGAAPDDAFDRDWSMQILKESVAELETVLRERGRSAVFEAFRLHDLAEDAPPGYDEIAERLGIKRSDVGNYLRSARQELRRLVIRAISAYVGDEQGILLEEEDILRRLQC